MTVKKWFADLPIQGKLTLINTTVVLVALAPVILFTLGYEYVSVRRAMLSEAEVQANIIRDNVAAATAFADTAAASEILQALRSSPNVTQAAVLLPGNVVLARYVNAEHSPTLITKGSGTDATSTDDSCVRVSRVIFLKQDAVGWLAIETSMQPLWKQLALYLLVNFLAGLLSFGIAYPLAKRLKESITGPLANLMALAQRVTSHNDYSPLKNKNTSKDEVGRLTDAFDSMLLTIRQRDLKLSRMAYYDNVTGLANRYYFLERLNRAVADTRRYGSRCCVMFIDLDNFKGVNDTYGHDVGDELLREVAGKLTAAVRDNDFVCRIGGDEFAVIVEDIKDLTGPSILADKIIAALSKPMHVRGEQLQVGASIGIAASPDHAIEISDLLRAADTAMYWAKEHGRNCFRIYTPLDAGGADGSHPAK